jgi:hypothetical protein
MPPIAISGGGGGGGWVGGRNLNEYAITHEPDIPTPMSVPQGSAEESEESNEIVEDPDNSPAIAQGSTSLKPLAGELIGDTSGAAAITSLPIGPKRMRETGMSSEAVMQACSERAKRRAGPRHTIILP